MKIKLLALCALLSVADASAQQKFSSLPIGYNLDGYISGIEILVVGDGLDASAWQSYPYSHNRDGKLEAFAAQKFRDYTASIKFANGNTYGWEIHAITDGIGGLLPVYSGKAASAVIASAPPVGESPEFHLTLRNDKWEVPEEVFGKVKFQFGAAISYYIPGVKDLEIRLYDKGIQAGRLSTREKTSDLKDLCELVGVILGFPNVAIPDEIARAQHLRLQWDYAEIDLYAQNESVTFIVNGTEQDGKAIRWSNPPPSFFTPPAPTPPKIASLKRVGRITEITVSAEASATAHLEFAAQLGGTWNAIPAYQVPLQLQTGSNKFTHTTETLSCFYRVRIVQTERQ